MKLKSKILGLAIFALAPAVAWGVEPGSGLAGSHHDFSGRDVTSNGEPWSTGLCTYCHTPHKALKTALLWNHTLSTNIFRWDDAKTTAGTNYPRFQGDTYSGPSAKCLSCHDGSVAIGDIAWFGEGKPTFDATETHPQSDPMNVGYGGVMSGNHPVAMPYPYRGARNTYNGSTTGEAYTSTEWVSEPIAPIRLFNDSAGQVTAGAVAGNTGIECSSCHDPHNKASVDDLFLRGKLGGSISGGGPTGYLCLACHIK